MTEHAFLEINDRLMLTRIELSSGTVRVAYHELSDALDLLADQYETAHGDER